MRKKQIKQLTKLNWDKAIKELWDSITLDVSKIKINYEEIKHLDKPIEGNILPQRYLY